MPQLLLPGTTVVAAHACGKLSDRCIDVAIGLRGSVAVMPCCYHVKHAEGPDVLTAKLGFRTAIDVHRTYRLHAAGYHVRWGAISEAITPMNRIIVATPYDPSDHTTNREANR